MDQSVPVADWLLGRYGTGQIASLSFDKGFTRAEDRELLSLYVPTAGSLTHIKAEKSRAKLSVPNKHRQRFGFLNRVSPSCRKIICRTKYTCYSGFNPPHQFPSNGLCRRWFERRLPRFCSSYPSLFWPQSPEFVCASPSQPCCGWAARLPWQCWLPF